LVFPKVFTGYWLSREGKTKITMAPRKPLLSFEMESPTKVYSPASDLGDEGMEIKQKKWYQYLPIIGERPC
jgi:hypothetical protein